MQDWNKVLSDLPRFVEDLISVKSVHEAKKIILKNKFHKLEVSDDTIIAFQVNNTFSNCFWYKVLTEIHDLEIIKLCCRFFNRYMIRPKDLFSFYMNYLSETHDIKHVESCLRILDQYRVTDYNCEFGDAIAMPVDDTQLSQTYIITYLPYVFFFATCPLRSKKEIRYFVEFIHFIASEFGADPTVGFKTPQDPARYLPLQSMRNQLLLIRIVASIQLSELNDIDHQENGNLERIHEIIENHFLHTASETPTLSAA